jgi:hypothetical protein
MASSKSGAVFITAMQRDFNDTIGRATPANAQ